MIADIPAAPGLPSAFRFEPALERYSRPQEKRPAPWDMEVSVELGALLSPNSRRQCLETSALLSQVRSTQARNIFRGLPVPQLIPTSDASQGI
jgi:hypothetical protein